MKPIWNYFEFIFRLGDSGFVFVKGWCSRAPTFLALIEVWDSKNQQNKNITQNHFEAENKVKTSENFLKTFRTIKILKAGVKSECFE